MYICVCVHVFIYIYVVYIYTYSHIYVCISIHPPTQPASHLSIHMHTDAPTPTATCSETGAARGLTEVGATEGYARDQQPRHGGFGFVQALKDEGSGSKILFT